MKNSSVDISDDFTADYFYADHSDLDNLSIF